MAFIIDGDMKHQTVRTLETMKRVCIEVYDDQPGEAGDYQIALYYADGEGGRFPIRTIAATIPDHYKSVYQAWAAKGLPMVDKRTVNPDLPLP